MKRELSLYLDLARFLAAALVVINHSNLRWLTTDTLPQLGHSAVMVFFVISGYVIAFVASEKETTLRDYSISRIGRIYSVAPIALLLTLVADYFGTGIKPEFYAGGYDAHDWWGLRLATSFFFVNEIWNISITSFSNVPYWSLNYEVWYYVMFAAITYVKGKARWWLFAAICLFLGPKVLLLAPIWWLGVYLFHSRSFAHVHEGTGWFMFCGSIILAILFHTSDVKHMLEGPVIAVVGNAGFKELAYSKWFLSDYLLGLIVFLNFVGFRAIAHRFSGALNLAAKPIRFLAGYTFALYLFHQPLILFFGALIQGDPSNSTFLIEVISLMLASVFLLGQITEKRKYFYRRLAKLVVDWVYSLRRRPSPI